MMSSKRRPQRVAARIREEVSRVVAFELAEPELEGMVVTDVEVTGDLRRARVFFSGVDNKEKSVRQGMRRAVPFIRRRLGEKVQLRTVPELEFEPDTHADEVGRLMRLLDENRENLR